MRTPFMKTRYEQGNTFEMIVEILKEKKTAFQ